MSTAEQLAPLHRLLAERERQGWPLTVVDPAALGRIATVLAGAPPPERGAAPGGEPGGARDASSAGRHEEVRRARS